MIDHITLPVKDIDVSRSFYLKAIEPLGYKIVSDIDERVPKRVGFAVNDTRGQRDLWIKESQEEISGSKYCIAFKAESKKVVEEFYKNAIKAGGIDNGKPGYRPKYHDGYYAAFVFDPDGYNIEAVFDDVK